MTNSVRTVIEGFSVSCFPGDDQVFCERVDEILEDARSTDPTRIRDLLIERLRPIYPKCEVRIRDPLAGFADAAIYVFRDGKAVSA